MKVFCWKPVLLLSFSVLLALPGKVASASLLYSIDANANSFIDASGNYHVGGSSSKVFTFNMQNFGQLLTIQQDSMLNSGVLEFKTLPSLPKDRSELTIYSNIEFGNTYYVGFRIFVPSNVTFLDNWKIFMQCPQHYANNSPPLTLEFNENGNFAIVTRSNEDNYEVVYEAPFQQGVWHRMILRMRLGEAGSLKLWHNDAVVADGIYRPIRWTNGDPKCTLKFGLYRGVEDGELTVRFDDVKLGTDYDSVKSW